MHMKHLSFSLFCLVVLTFIVTSCSVEKRRYLDGYHVEWHNRRSEYQTQIAEKNTESIDTTKVLTHSVPSLESILTSDQSSNTQIITNKNAEKKTLESNVGQQKSGGISKAIAPFREIKGARGMVSTLVESYRVPAPETKDLNSIGLALAVLGLVFAVLAIAFFAIAVFIAVDWAALGYLILAIFAAGFAGLFSWIAQAIFWHHHQGVPWFQWPGIILGLIGLYALIRIVFKI